MLKLKGQNIRFKYNNATENIFDDLSFMLHDDMKVGIIGDNGCGKSTLLKIVCGLITPNDGKVIIPSPGAYLPQDPKYTDISVEEYLFCFDERLLNARRIMYTCEISEKVVQAVDEFDRLGGFKFEENLSKVINQVELSEIDLNRSFNTLSGGEKTRAAIARLLITDPAYLLLDEPTNHLDIEAKEWLMTFLQNTKLPFILVSHDRAFLDSVVNQIWELKSGIIKEYSGNYSFAEKEQSVELERKKKEYQNSMKKITGLKADYNNKRNWALQFQAQTGKNGFAPVYEELDNNARRAMRRAKVMERRVERELEQAKENKPFIEKEHSIFIETQLPGNEIICEVEELSKSFDEKMVFKDLSFKLKRGDKIHLIGKNGSGKTTLFNLLTGNLRPDNGKIRWVPKAKIGYYCQEHQNLDDKKSALKNVYSGMDKDKESKSRIVLGCLGIKKDKVFSLVEELSPGEKSKVMLAKVIIKEPNVLLMDEPTNHLEMSSRKKLEDALVEYKGCIIFVSHDEVFANKIKNRMIFLDQ